jgi:hypothetical protein
MFLIPYHSLLLFRPTRTRRPPTTSQRVCGFLGTYWRSLAVVITPLLFLPIMLQNDDEKLVKAYRCLWVVCVVRA